MLVNTKKKTLCLNKSSVIKKISSWIEQDIIVPDTKPDALKIVNISVIPYVSNYEVMEGKIKVTGKISYFVIYNASDEKFGTRGLYVTYPFSDILNLDDVKSNMNILIKPSLKNVIYSLPNERKIAIKSEVCFKICTKDNIKVDLVKEFEYDGKIEINKNKKIFQNIIEHKNSIIASKEDVMLPKEAEDFYELLKAKSVIINTDYKDSFNKIMVKGDIITELVYLCENQVNKVKKVSITTPFSAMIELSNISEKSKFDIKYIMEDFNIKVNSDITSSKTLNIDYQIYVDVNMYEEEEVEYIDDFYSQTKNLDIKYSEKEIVTEKKMFSKYIDIKENVSNILNSNSYIIDNYIDTNYLTVKKEGKCIVTQGNAKLVLLIQNMENNEIETKHVDIMVNDKYELNDLVNRLDEDVENNIDITYENLSIIQSGSNLDVKFKLCMEVEAYDKSKIMQIEKIEEQPLDVTNLDSINIYIVKAGDSIWKIAKKYKTSVDNIVKINNIENPDVIDVGQKILVIR